MRSVEVVTADHRYEVTIGPGALQALPRTISDAGAGRVVVVTQQGVPAVDHGLEAPVLTIGPGEEVKTLATVERLARGFAAAGLTRRDVVVAVGGGAVTDVAGFAAAVWHRGTPVVHVPTTLLGQVDAAIGGKTGVNLPEGKNLIGAFWQPTAVICDTDLLATLPEREWRSGLGEVVKCELLGAGALLGRRAEEVVEACVRLKADVVAADEREASGRRDILNLGHTLGHALETAGYYDLRHGEAVAIGLCFAAVLAARLGRVPPTRPAEVTDRVAAYGLPTGLPTGADPPELVRLMASDKKSRGGLRFVLDGPRGYETADVEVAEVQAALESFGQAR